MRTMPPAVGCTRVKPWLCVLALVALMTRAATAQAMTPRIAAGEGFSAALSSDGQLRTWGQGNSGQLGRMSGAFGVPGLVSGLGGIVDVACGGAHMLALTATGQVKVWGRSNFGQLGLGNTMTQLSPQVLPGVTAAAGVAAGDTHSLVLLTSGVVLAFGEGTDGRLGLGNTSTSLVPTQIPGLANVVSISAGARHSAAITSSGALHVWGGNASGQLGISGVWSSSVPAPVPGLSGVTAVACGYTSTLCTNAAGVLCEWGNMSPATTLPQVVAMPTAVIAIDSAASMTCQLAVAATGAVFAWGQDCNGLLGTASSTCTTVVTPIQLTGLGAGIASIALGGMHALTLTATGSVQSWGSNSNSQLGYSTPGAFSASPAVLPGLDLTVFELYLVPAGASTELRYFHGSPASLYANLCTASPQSSTAAGLMNFGGLWLSFGDFLAWSMFIQAGYPMATGSLNALGSAVTTLPVLNSALTGLTIHAVSFNLLAGSITNTSHVVTHTF